MAQKLVNGRWENVEGDAETLSKGDVGQAYSSGGTTDAGLAAVAEAARMRAQGGGAAGASAPTAPSTPTPTSAPPPVPGGGGYAGAFDSMTVSGASGQGSRANMPSADFAATPTPIAMGGGSAADASGFRQGSPGALNPRLGNAPQRNSMSALASIGKAY